MSFSNRIRLPIEIIQPQFPIDKTVYRKADGTRKTISVVISKTYQGFTDFMPEQWHQRLCIALGHDSVTIEGDKYLGGVSQDGEYTIEWNTVFKDYPTAKAKFVVQVTPFDATNSNCMTCEQATQLSLVDDEFPSALLENTTYTINVATNDEICCYPALFEITSYNTTYLSSASIDQSGVVTVHTKTGLHDANSINLVTYRVTCPNGGFDEANVVGDIDGTLAAVCLAPKSLTMFTLGTTNASVRFVQPSTLPDHYHLIVYKTATPGIIENAHDVATNPPPGSFQAGGFSGLDPGTNYTICVRSQCDATNNDATASNYICIGFTTSPQTQLCGQYGLFFDDAFGPGPGAGGHINVSYVDCNGVTQTVYVPNHVSVAVCAMQTSPGSPTYISAFGNPNFHFNYEGQNC